MIIDGIDILKKYSAILLDGSLESFIQYPNLKTPKKNDWAEFDGIEVDLSSPRLDKKNVTLNILIDVNNIDSFASFLMAKTYRFYHSKELNYGYILRFFEILEINREHKKYAITVKLIDDTPLNGYNYTEVNLKAVDNDYNIDGVNILTYGLTPLEGTINNLEKIIKVKNKLENKSNYIDGVIVAEQISKKSEYNATLKFFINQSKADFFKGYNAFLYNLVQPNERILIAKNATYTFYYLKSRVENIVIKNENIWCSYLVSISVTSALYYNTFSSMALGLGYKVNEYSTFDEMAINLGYIIL